jgi:molybdopterin synthase catalytic subunit
MLIEVLDCELSLERCLAEVRKPGSGGIVTFTGCVRDVSEGKQVDFLEYEAYVPMAVDKLHEVAREACDRWPVSDVAIQHRIGRLEIGEDAVVMAVSCPHRAEAFAACKYIIDRIKEVVPIWKKEHGEGGQVWVEGPRAAG